MLLKILIILCYYEWEVWSRYSACSNRLEESNDSFLNIVMLSLLAQVVVEVEVVTGEVALEVALETFHVSFMCLTTVTPENLRRKKILEADWLPKIRYPYIIELDDVIPSEI